MPLGPGFLVKDAVTVSCDKPRDRLLDLKQLLARVVLLRQVEQQMAMLDI